MLFHIVCFNNYSYRAVQMGKIIDNEEINSYYKGFPMFENLTDLRLYWTRYIYSWDEVMKMLQNCPKLQALKIRKVCLSQQWIVTSFYLFFSFLRVFLQILFFLIYSGRIHQPKRIGNIHVMFLNVSRLA